MALTSRRRRLTNGTCGRFSLSLSLSRQSDWRQVAVSRQPVSLHDNYFHALSHSIAALFGILISVKNFYRLSTSSSRQLFSYVIYSPVYLSLSLSWHCHINPDLYCLQIPLVSPFTSDEESMYVRADYRIYRPRESNSRAIVSWSSCDLCFTPINNPRSNLKYRHNWNGSDYRRNSRRNYIYCIRTSFIGKKKKNKNVGPVNRNFVRHFAVFYERGLLESIYIGFICIYCKHFERKIY